MAIPQEYIETYTRIIDGIFGASDLSTISAKRVRKGVAALVDHDVEPHKQALTDLILERFDAANAAAAAKTSTPPAAAPVKREHPIKREQPNGNGIHLSPPAKTNGVKREAPSHDDHYNASSATVSPAPPAAKKHRHSQSVEDSDAAFAARLQAEENGRARSTRGGQQPKRKAPAKKGDKKSKVKAKSKTKVGSDDDSDLATGEEKEVNRTGGFHKPMLLSPPLAELLGETQLSRPQTVKRIWQYIKAHELQDPEDKRNIRCDEALRNIFKQDKVHMFTMNKILGQHLYAIDE